MASTKQADAQAVLARWLDRQAEEADEWRDAKAMGMSHRQFRQYMKEQDKLADSYFAWTAAATNMMLSQLVRGFAVLHHRPAVLT